MVTVADIQTVWRARLNQSFWCLLSVALLVVVGCAAAPAEKGTRRVEVGEFSRLLDSNEFGLLDVRTPEEFAQGHIPGAINLDVNSASFDEAVRSLDPDRGWLVYCRSGRRSAVACGRMAEAGFDELVDLAPGFNGWQAADKPVAR